MNTRILINQEIEKLDAENLDLVYQMIKRLQQGQRSKTRPSFMAQLRQIQIDGPEDFARNLDQYLSGEKCE